MIHPEAGAAKAWILAFVIMAGVGIGTLVGVGCLVGANTCPGGKPRAKQTSTDGMVLFETNCAACHGRDGKGLRGAPSLVSGTLGGLSAEELAPKISKGKPLGGMPRFRNELTDEQIKAVAEYVVRLRGAA
jgi:cbb3-type cytochrome c oxidase subunit III